MSYYYEKIITHSIENFNSTFEWCIIGCRIHYYNCTFRNCVFNNKATTFEDCKFINNVYPNECDWEVIKLDVYKNRLPEGDLIVYKKVYNDNDSNRSSLVAKLLIPAKAKRVNGASNKCRAEYAKVLGFYTLTGNRSRVKVCKSGHNCNFKYRVGDIVKPTTKFDTSVKVCSTGIHFLLTFDEAKNYY